MTAERLERARAAEAPIYARDRYLAAETALTDARQRFEERDYGAALSAASLASIRADEAYARALLSKQRVTRQARRQLQEVMSLLEEARSRGIPDAEKAHLEALADRLGALERELDRGEAATVYEEGMQLKNEALKFLNRFRRNGGR